MLRQILGLSAVCCLLSLLAVNGAVRVIGDGYPKILTTRFFNQKVEALRLFAHHLQSHPFGDPHPDTALLLEKAAKANQLPLALVKAVAIAESELRPHRISAAGAMGMMQLMPGTAADLKVKDPFHSAQNIDGGARYLRYLWRRYHGDLTRVIAGYNAGPGNVPRQGKLQLPGETRHYLKRVLREYRRLNRQATSQNAAGFIINK